MFEVQCAVLVSSSKRDQYGIDFKLLANEFLPAPGERVHPNWLLVNGLQYTYQSDCILLKEAVEDKIPLRILKACFPPINLAKTQATKFIVTLSATAFSSVKKRSRICIPFN